MNRPIYEPTPARYDAYNDFGNQQLFRRPAPESGTTEVEYFRATRYNNTLSSGTGTAIAATFEAWEFCNTSVFEPEAPGGGDPTPGVDLLARVNLLVDGLYSFNFGTDITGPTTGMLQLLMHDGDDITGTPQGVIHGPEQFNDGGGQKTFSSGAEYVLSFMRLYPLYDQMNASGGFIPSISFTVAYNGSTAKDLFDMWMDIYYFPNITLCPPGSS